MRIIRHTAVLLFLGVHLTCFGQPAPGQWMLYPDTLISGQVTPLELRYEHTGDPLPRGSYHRLLIEPVSVKTLYLTPPSTDLRIVPFKGDLPNVNIDPLPVDGVGYRQVKFVFPDGIKTGQSFAVQMGNLDAEGNITAIINPVPVNTLSFETFTGLPRAGQTAAQSPYVERDWQASGWFDSLVKINIQSTVASQVRVFAPSLIEAGTAFSVRLSVTDAFDSEPHPMFEGR